MAQLVKLKRSATAGKVPETSDLELGELALNTNDGRAFFKKNDGSDSIQHLITTNSETTGSINLVGDITASGGFLLGGSIYHKDYNTTRFGFESNTHEIDFISNGFLVLTLDKANGSRLGINTSPIEISGNEILLSDASVTASYSISASGDMLASNFITPKGGKLNLNTGIISSLVSDNNLYIDGTDSADIIFNDSESSVDILIRGSNSNYYFKSDGSNEKVGIGGNWNGKTPGQELTVQGNISASGNLFADLTDANGSHNNTVMYNTTTGRFYYTGSYGGGGGGGGSGTVTEVTVGAGLDVTNGTTTPNITLDLTEITLSNGLDSTATGLSLDLTEVIANGNTANLILTSDGDGTLTAEPGLAFDGKLFYPNSGDLSTGVWGTYYDLVDDIESNADLFVGDIASVGTAITTTAGGICNLSGSWAPAQANSLSTSAGLLGIATVSVSSNVFLLRGYFSVDDSLIQGNPVIGSPIYISATQAGRYAFSPPSVGNVSRIIGHLVDTWTPDRGANYYYKIYFNPSPEYIET